MDFRLDYVQALWWLMHHSRDSGRRALALAHYLDESGQDERSSVTVVGGPVFAEKHFYEIHYEWDRAVCNHGIQMPIHMKDFARPDGRLAYVSNDERKSLFYDLVYLINRYKAYSLSAEVDSAAFRQPFPPSVFRGHLTSASFAFLWCMVLNHGLAKEHSISRIAYLFGRSPENTQMTDAYNFFTSYEERNGEEFTGSLNFDSPKCVNALQAADLIAWANRRKCAGMPFDEGYDALELLTRYVESEEKPNIHFHFPVRPAAAETLADLLGKPVRHKGRRNSLLGLIPSDWKTDETGA